MRSANQTKASRENGAQSKGPVTAEGKLKVAQNAIKHGLTAKNVVLTIDDQDAFNEMQKSFYDRFQPADDAEWYMVEEIGTITWKIRQAWSIQQNMYQIQMTVSENTNGKENYEEVPVDIRRAFLEADQSGNKGLENIRRHEDRLYRQRDRVINQLRKLQKDRRDAEPPPQPVENTQPEPAKPQQQNKPKTLVMVANTAPYSTPQSVENQVQPDPESTEPPPSMS